MDSKVTQLHSRAKSLAAKFKQGDGSHHIDEAVTLNREALALCSPGHPMRQTSLSWLSSHLSDRYDQLGAMADVEEAIVLSREALALRPPGQPDRLTCLNNLGLYLSTRYEQLGVMEDLDEAVILAQEVLGICSPSDPDRATFLNNVAYYISAWYEQLGRMEDLNEAIILGRDTLALRPPGNPNRTTSLNNLARYLSTRYQQLGRMEDMDEAILLDRDALALCPQRHPDYSLHLNNLAVDLSYRHKRLKALEDLDEAIVLGRDALSLRPPGHPDRSSSLTNVAQYLSTRHEQLGEMEDLDEAIMLGRNAVALRPPGHPDRSTSLSDMAADLSARYQWLGRMEDLDEAIALGRDTLALRLPGHPSRSTCFNNVAHYLSIRYERLGGMEDLDEAISLSRDALALRPPGHSNRSLSLDNLASYLCMRLARSCQLDDKEELFSLYTQMALLPETLSSADLSTTKAWIRAAEHFYHPTTLLAYETYLRLLVRHLAALPLLPHHLDVLKNLTSSLAVDAFSACVRYHSPTKAVELLEQGRGVFWSQLIRLNAQLDDVVSSGSAGRTLAKRFTEVSLLIRNALDSPGADQHDRVCHLNIDLEKVVNAIRELPGLSHFLLPSPFSDLRQAASGGPVIIMNASKYSCDALVILFDREPVHIPLQITQADVRRLASELHTWTVRAKFMSVAKYLVVILRQLWDKVVSPVVDFLQKIHPFQSRIWWCPTAEFSLLPLHAAGSYRKDQPRLADLYISSYTSTLSALIRARRQEPSNYVTRMECFVAIGQGKAAGESELHSINAELTNIRQRIGGLVTFTCVEGPNSSIPRVVQELNMNQWAHLACHGIPNQKQPFKSAFALHDGHFTVERIIRSHLPNSQFAYLSACHTTVGDGECPDEMIHLASAMQFSGFRSVIGTMWAVDDGQTTKITSKFYDNMVNESGRLDHTRAAFALNKTMKELEGHISFDQLILYVHIGA